MDGGQEGSASFVIARCNSAILLESGKEVLDQVAGFVHIPVEAAALAPIGFRRDHDLLAGRRQWLKHAFIGIGRPPFCAVTKVGKVTGEKLSDQAVVRLVKQAAAGAGLDPDKFAGHSLRRGLLTAGADNRANLAELMRQSRHRSAQSVLGYLEPADLWRNNVTEGVFRQRESEDGTNDRQAGRPRSALPNL